MELPMKFTVFKTGQLQEYRLLINHAIRSGIGLPELQALLTSEIQKRTSQVAAQQKIAAEAVSAPPRKTCPDCGRMMRLEAKELDNQIHFLWNCVGSHGCAHSEYIGTTPPVSGGQR